MKKLFLLSILILTFSAVSGQSSNFDIGFYTEVTKRSNRIKVNKGVFTDVQNVNKSGFGIGFNLYYIFHPKIKTRLTNAILFESEEFSYFNSSVEEIKKSEVAFISFGLHGIFKTSHKLPINVVIGMTPYFGLHDDEEQTDLKFKKSDLSGDIGLSYTINFKTFKCSPEIRYSKSFINASIDKSIYGRSIESHHRNRFSFSLSFFTK